VNLTTAFAPDAILGASAKLVAVFVFAMAGAIGVAAEREPIRFDQAFEGGSLGQIEQVGEGAYRLHVAGQQDNRGRNRQASWFFFRMENVRGRELVLTFTDYIGEYNDRPGAVPMGAELRPVFSYDGENWRHFAAMAWDETKKEATLRLAPEQDRVWIAHVPPYPPSRLQRLLGEIARSPVARVEVIGRTVFGRDLHLVTITNTARADPARRTVWLQARQHAWEAGTSFVMEGALRFIVSDDPRARELRDGFNFIFTPMIDPDGSAAGQVRYNAHGYDLNRHWDLVDVNDRTWLERIPETWYVKKAVLAHLDAGRRIDLYLNLHNTETSEYLTGLARGPGERVVQRLFQQLVEQTTFDPSRPLTLAPGPLPADPGAGGSMWTERGVPYCLMEQRIGPGRKLGRLPTTEDRLEFGRRLIELMAESVR
jgi:hypothetical protein